MGTVKAGWGSRYMIQQVATRTTAPTFTAASNIGLEGTGAAAGIYVAPLLNASHINPGYATVEHITSTGRSDLFPVYDMTTVATEPASITLEMPLNAYNLSLFSWLLFQNGTTETEDAVTMLMICKPYTSPLPEIYCTIVRVMADSLATKPNVDTMSHILYGGICRSLTISGSSGDILRLSAEIVGSYAIAAAATDLTLSPPKMLINNAATNWDTFALPTSTISPIRFSALTVTFGAADTAKGIDDFSITFTNDAAMRYYNENAVQGEVLQRINGSGSFTLAWGQADYTTDENDPINDFVDGTLIKFRFYNTDLSGGHGAGNNIDCTTYIRYTDTNIDTDPEVKHNLNFRTGYNGTNDSINLRMDYTKAVLDRGCTAP